MNDISITKKIAVNVKRKLNGYIKNEPFKDTGNIGHKTQNEDNKVKNTEQKIEKLKR